MRTRTEREQNGYRTDTKRKWNGYGTVMNRKNGKSICDTPYENTSYETWQFGWNRVSKGFIFRTHASKLRYQSAYQGFGNNATLNTRSSNFCPERRSWENYKMNHVMSLFFFLHALSKHLPCFPVHCGHFIIVNKPKLCPNKVMDGQVELDLDWKVSSWRETKQNIDVLVDLYYGIVPQLCGRISNDNINNITKSITKCLLRLFVSTVHHWVLGNLVLLNEFPERLPIEH